MIYKDIPTLPGYRAGSTAGVIQSCMGKKGLGRGKGTASVMLDTWHDLKHRTDRDGYLHVRAHRDRKKLYPMVHTLVLTAFKGPPKPGQQCRHRDGNKLNNDASNLLWGTVTENNRDRVKHDTIPHGENNKWSKLTVEIVLGLLRDTKAGVPVRQQAKQLGVTTGCLYSVLNGSTWTRITGLPRRRNGDKLAGETNRYKKLLNGETRGGRIVKSPNKNVPGASEAVV